MNDVLAVHSMVRNAPLSRQHMEGLRATERFAEEILSGDERQTGGNVDQIISQIRNMTDFNSAGERITGCSRYPSIDGSCNHGSGKI
jgi:hypothetical protein